MRLIDNSELQGLTDADLELAHRMLTEELYSRASASASSTRPARTLSHTEPRMDVLEPAESVIEARPTVAGRRRRGRLTSAKIAREASLDPSAEKGLAHFIGLGLSGGLLALMLLIAALVVGIPSATHATPYTVLTSSMEPSLPPGSLLVVRPIDPGAIRIGDVVTYQLQSDLPAVVTHRVTAITTNDKGERLFTFKGDNNPSPDAMEVREVQIRGKLWYAVPLIGWVNTLLNGESRAWLVPIAVGGLFAYSGWMVISGIVSAARKRRADEIRGIVA